MSIKSPKMVQVQSHKLRVPKPQAITRSNPNNLSRAWSNSNPVQSVTFNANLCNRGLYFSPSQGNFVVFLANPKAKLFTINTCTTTHQKKEKQIGREASIAKARDNRETHRRIPYRTNSKQNRVHVTSIKTRRIQHSQHQPTQVSEPAERGDVPSTKKKNRREAEPIQTQQQANRFDSFQKVVPFFSFHYI